MPGFDGEPAAISGRFGLLDTQIISKYTRKKASFFTLFGCRQNVFYYKLHMLDEGIITE